MQDRMGEQRGEEEGADRQNKRQARDEEWQGQGYMLSFLLLSGKKCFGKNITENTWYTSGLHWLVSHLTTRTTGMALLCLIVIVIFAK